MRITDVFLALPGPILAIAVVAALGPSLQHTLIAVAIVWWPFYARIVRGEVKALAARPHVEAARLAGVGRWRLAFRHLLPGAIPAIVVTASLDVGNLVLTLVGAVVSRTGSAGARPRARGHGRPWPAVPAPAVVGADHARAGRPLPRPALEPGRRRPPRPDGRSNLMARLIAKRLLAMVGVLLFLAAVVFTLQHNTPTSPVHSFLGANASQAGDRGGDPQARL